MARAGILYQVGSRYTVDDGKPELADRTYLFASDTGNASYFLVRTDADGTTGSIVVAGRALPGPTPYEFSKNTITEQMALAHAWTSHGAALVERCGPLRWIDVSGGVRDEGQWWSVGYRTHATVHTAFLDAATGEVFERDEVSC